MFCSLSISRHANCKSVRDDVMGGHEYPIRLALHTIALSGGGEAVARLTVTAVTACSVNAFCITLANWAILTLVNICKQEKN